MTTTIETARSELEQARQALDQVAVQQDLLRAQKAALWQLIELTQDPTENKALKFHAGALEQLLGDLDKLRSQALDELQAAQRRDAAYARLLLPSEGRPSDKLAEDTALGRARSVVQAARAELDRRRSEMSQTYGHLAEAKRELQVIQVEAEAGRVRPEAGTRLGDVRAQIGLLERAGHVQDETVKAAETAWRAAQVEVEQIGLRAARRHVVVRDKLAARPRKMTEIALAEQVVARLRAELESGDRQIALERQSVVDLIGTENDAIVVAHAQQLEQTEKYDALRQADLVAYQQGIAARAQQTVSGGSTSRQASDVLVDLAGEQGRLNEMARQAGVGR